MEWIMKPVDEGDELGCFCLLVFCYTNCPCNNPSHSCSWIYSCHFSPPVCGSNLCKAVDQGI
ncbi:hypothetical protein XO10_08170 [Marinitoga sp. 1135]|uniref:hypothetical protein n=1 Tax=Marinitoga sp. 1135 TaxID=1643333 RepID=UPI0015866638|nr:hypothetical protein [Marinitoga sp. 1135]NUU96230.1 hypothetical protein [Marinitoga sp. 1135]NUU98153.1 hypothetical protein [Marinitoga sp. 1138]